MNRLAALALGALLVASPAAAAPSSDPPRPEQVAPAPAERGPKLGIVAVELTPELRDRLGGAPDRGVLVGRVLPGSAADAAGLEVGDVLILVDGKPVDEAADIRAALRGKVDGAKVELRVRRDGKDETRTATLAMPESTADLLDLFLFPFDWWARDRAPRA